jgi:hypothetical protein
MDGPTYGQNGEPGGGRTSALRILTRPAASAAARKLGQAFVENFFEQAQQAVSHFGMPSSSERFRPRFSAQQLACGIEAAVEILVHG